MALDAIIRDTSTGVGAGVDAQNRIKIVLPLAENSDGGVRIHGENDNGFILGTASLKSPEIDVDYRMRTSTDVLLDEENFSYTSQNTGKHSYRNTTMVNAWNVGGLTTNNTNITTASTGTLFSTYSYFPIKGTQTLSCDMQVSFSSAPVTNTIIDFGLFTPSVTNPYAPSDGVFFRLTSAGLIGVVNYNGVETQTGVFPTSSTNSTPWGYSPNKKYQFILYVTPRLVEFWINDDGDVYKYAELSTPTAYGQPCASSSQPFSVRHAIVGGAASSALSMQLSRYNVRVGGAAAFTTLSTEGLRLFGSYQGLSGGTMGSLANYANSTNPTAAVPTNTSAALGTGLGGQFWETATLAVNTDGIICSYQVPSGTVATAGRRLVIRGIGLSSYIQTVIAGGPFINQYSLAFGHNAISLATTESANTKAPRRVPLSGFTQAVTAAQTVSTIVQQQDRFHDFGDAPIIVNPNEFVQLVVKRIGTAATSGVIAHVVTFIYGWE